jgi:excisionase family DNA binding protein
VGRERGGVGASVGARAVLVSRLWVWVVIALLSVAAGCRVCAAARARVPRRSSPRAPEGPSRLTAAACPLRRTLARHGFRAGGPFRDLRASLEQRPMSDEAHRSPDHPLDGPSRDGVTFEPPVAPKADRPLAPATFLSTDECARRAMLSRKAIYRAIESGELLAFRVRARLRVPEEEFSRWMTADPVSSAPSGPPHGISARRPAPAGSFRSVLRTVGRSQA